MALVCANCSRTNPAEAAYCYNDGAALAGQSTGPIDAGSRLFVNPFVFPNGLACRNFDQLAMACQHHWKPALEVLHKGFLGAFFAGIGRADLALAAHAAARFPDPDRGLDQLLTALPTQVLAPPKLAVEPSVMNLGLFKVGEDRVTELHLTNLGMRLLYGTVTSDCAWLTVGDGAGQGSKLFQIDGDTIIPVHVKGQHLRAGARPTEGRLVIESNGGAVTVVLRVEVPITPYAEGAFAGAVTPRQIAEKALVQPKESAPHFESGAIARWYADNGWTYPVQGPVMPGLGGIQQFFEALGVTKPPAVAFAPSVLDFQGTAGATIETGVAITANDTKRKVVYGWATCEQPWVVIGATVLGKNRAVIPISLRLPAVCPSLLTGAIHVFGNGKQAAVMAIRVSVQPGKPVSKSAPAPEAFDVTLVDDQPATVIAGPVKTAKTAAPFTFAEPRIHIRSSPPRPPDALQLACMFGPLVLLSLCVALLMWHDHGVGSNEPRVELKEDGGDEIPVVKKTVAVVEPSDIDPRPQIMLKFDEGFKGVDYTDSMSFAVHKIGPDGKNAVKLNWYDNGLGNSTVVRVDQVDNRFGSQVYGYWHPTGPAADVGRPGGKKRTFVCKASSVHVTQTVTIEPGQPVRVAPNEFKRPLNVCLVRYTLQNRDGKTHHVGLRTLLDTCIGDNDGVPFTIPGENELVDTARDLYDREVPHFVQVLQRPDLNDPGIIVHLNMRIAERMEIPYRFSLTRYPVSVTARKADLNRWDIPIVPIGDDSCVVMYWAEKDLRPNETREVAFSYGLGQLSISENDTKVATKGRLALTIGGAMYVNGEFTVVALVADLTARKTTLTLPADLELVSTGLSRPVAKAVAAPDGKVRPVPVTWRIRAVREGNHAITVRTDSGLEQTHRVTINRKSLFN